ncbi:ATP-binding protein [Photobacterium indicum]|uniref:ATP-binding protein n=1 Tax=Photobacterium indicum TaxID=81447 RepID=UPI003D0B7066
MNPETVQTSANVETWSLSRFYRWLFPLGLVSRFVIMLTLVILSSQIITSAVWYRNIYLKEKEGLEVALENITSMAAYTVAYYQKLPKSSRHLVLEQNRSMGGTRFFISLNSKQIPISGLPDTERKQALTTQIAQNLVDFLGEKVDISVDFTKRNLLRVYDAEVSLDDIPRAFARYTIEKAKHDPPVLVMQLRLPTENRGSDDTHEQWLYLATNLPAPYVGLDVKFLDSRQLNFILLTSVCILLFTWFLVRHEIRPINKLAQAAKMMGNKIDANIIKEEGSGELVAAVHAFNTMNRRIRAYIRDRDLLFGAISHDLKTPIACLKLRIEMLENEDEKKKFERSLSELEFMVKGALNYIKNTDINEQLAWVDLEAVLRELCLIYNADKPRVFIHGVLHSPLLGKPVALKRMFNNLMENAVKYGDKVEISLSDRNDEVVIQFRDYGNGIPDELREKVFEPYYRVAHEKQEGTGLGLSIVRNIVLSHHGKLVLTNHPEGGLIAVLSLPREG